MMIQTWLCTNGGYTFTVWWYKRDCVQAEDTRSRYDDTHVTVLTEDIRSRYDDAKTWLCTNGGYTFTVWCYKRDCTNGEYTFTVWWYKHDCVLTENIRSRYDDTVTNVTVYYRRIYVHGMMIQTWLCTEDISSR